MLQEAAACGTPNASAPGDAEQRGCCSIAAVTAAECHSATGGTVKSPSVTPPTLTLPPFSSQVATAQLSFDESL